MISDDKTVARDIILMKLQYRRDHDILEIFEVGNMANIICNKSRKYHRAFNSIVHSSQEIFIIQTLQ